MCVYACIPLIQYNKPYNVLKNSQKGIIGPYQCDIKRMYVEYKNFRL